MNIKKDLPHQPESHIYIKFLSHVYIKLGLEIGPQVYLRTKKNIAVVHIVGSVFTNAPIVTMHPFRMHIWRHTWKTQQGKGSSNFFLRTHFFLSIHKSKDRKRKETWIVPKNPENNKMLWHGRIQAICKADTGVYMLRPVNTKIPLTHYLQIPCDIHCSLCRLSFAKKAWY